MLRSFSASFFVDFEHVLHKKEKKNVFTERNSNKVSRQSAGSDGENLEVCNFFVSLALALPPVGLFDGKNLIFKSERKCPRGQIQKETHQQLPTIDS
jgi:hypothetical protein